MDKSNWQQANQSMAFQSNQGKIWLRAKIQRKNIEQDFWDPKKENWLC